MSLQKKIENNFKQSLSVENSSEPLFVPTSKEKFDALKSLIGDKSSKLIDFYKDSQPNQIWISVKETMVILTEILFSGIN